jgi:hypothetical protein
MLYRCTYTYNGRDIFVVLPLHLLFLDPTFCFTEQWILAFNEYPADRVPLKEYLELMTQ